MFEMARHQKSRYLDWSKPFKARPDESASQVSMRRMFEQDRKKESDEVNGRDLYFIENFQRDYLITFDILSISPNLFKEFSEDKIRNEIDAFILAGDWEIDSNAHIDFESPDGRDYIGEIILGVKGSWPSKLSVDEMGFHTDPVTGYRYSDAKDDFEEIDLGDKRKFDEVFGDEPEDYEASEERGY